MIEFHVCINCFYNETAHYADIVLPWATYMERWDLDARGAYNLRPYVGLRTPMVEPLGESKDVREFFPELAKRIGGGMEAVVPRNPSKNTWNNGLPTCPRIRRPARRGLERLLDEGVWEADREPFYEPYNIDDRRLNDMQGAVVDERSGVIMKDGVGIGIMQGGQAGAWICNAEPQVRNPQPVRAKDRQERRLFGTDRQ